MDKYLTPIQYQQFQQHQLLQNADKTMSIDVKFAIAAVVLFGVVVVIDHIWGAIDLKAAQHADALERETDEIINRKKAA